MDNLERRATQYERLGMEFGFAMRLANLERLTSVTSLSRAEENELAQLRAELAELERRQHGRI